MEGSGGRLLRRVARPLCLLCCSAENFHGGRFGCYTGGGEHHESEQFQITFHFQAYILSRKKQKNGGISVTLLLIENPFEKES